MGTSPLLTVGVAESVAKNIPVKTIFYFFLLSYLILFLLSYFWRSVGTSPLWGADCVAKHVPVKTISPDSLSAV